MSAPSRHGFTLIELSIVLVIIGLIVGGVLVGRDLIKAAEIRAQISQIEGFKTAVNTFKVKYGYLPGDIPEPHASGFGFATRGTSAGMGDGNGIIQGADRGGDVNLGSLETTGETTMFWADLSLSGLIAGKFTDASPSVAPINVLTSGSTPSLAAFFPKAKLGRENYVYVWSGGMSANNGQNYYGISVPTTIYQGGGAYSDPGMTVLDAYNIDTKIDDGMPQSGNALAIMVHDGNDQRMFWAAGGGNPGAQTSWNYGLATNAATSWDANNCYDNNNVAGVQKYSLSQNSNSVNCAISIRF